MTCHVIVMNIHPPQFISLYEGPLGQLRANSNFLFLTSYSMYRAQFQNYLEADLRSLPPSYQKKLSQAFFWYDSNIWWKCTLLSSQIHMFVLETVSYIVVIVIPNHNFKCGEIPIKIPIKINGRLENLNFSCE